MEFSRQEYWSGLPFPTPGDLPDPGIEPASLPSPVLAGGFFTTSATVFLKEVFSSNSQMVLVVKNFPANEGDIEDMGQSLSREDPLEDMATHSSILAWRIPWT